MPEQWQHLLNNSGISKEDQAKNPQVIFFLKKKKRNQQKTNKQ